MWEAQRGSLRPSCSKKVFKGAFQVRNGKLATSNGLRWGGFCQIHHRWKKRNISEERSTGGGGGDERERNEKETIGQEKKMRKKSGMGDLSIKNTKGKRRRREGKVTK